ncbi:YafY family protein [Ahrensia sp. R2A130]|uniref:helix-turn-helix transcriptional regulator n=1 Tax=Ahrensia sp. R2A130 TaxID=744979 RepID=UPI0001E0D0E7|nr:YafY family protein [Ahrensia sp. R2A130]EFL89264.1 helix-turn-helix type 11 domain-containing protein [Ahrensia sp. R2A130]
MRRADRLIRIVQFLRSRSRAVTGQQIADEFGICTRTVYRDMQALMDSHIPISGEAGVGYVIDKRYYMPPVAFDMDELEAIGLGIAMVRQWTDDEFAQKAMNAFDKIQTVLPAEIQSEMQQITTYSIPDANLVPWTVSFSHLRECIREHRKIGITYTDERGRESARTLRPLALIFATPVWVLASWCETRRDFRNFRLDRIGKLEASDDIFDDEEDKGLEAFKAADAF